MIKGWMKKIGIGLMAAGLAVMLVLITPVPKDAKAEGESQAIVAYLMEMQAVVLEALVQGFTDAATGAWETIQNTVMPKLEETISLYSQEERLAQIEQTKYIGEVKQAKLSQEAVIENEKTRLEDVRDARVSAGECKLITAANLQTAGEKDAKAYEAVLSEMLRKDNNFVKGGISESGVVVRNSILKAGVFQEFCSKDEHQGNLEEICLNTDEKSVGKDTATYLLTKDHTIPKEDFDAAVQMIRYLVPVPSVNPLPKSLSDDPATQAAYLQRTKEDAKYEPYERWLIEQVSRHMEPQKCPKVPGSDFDRVAFVNEIDKRLGRPVSTDRPCPSQAEFEYYTNKHMMVDPTFVSECNEGKTQTESCMVGIEMKKTSLAYHRKALKDKSLLMKVSDSLENKKFADAPVGSIGADYVPGDPQNPLCQDADPSQLTYTSDQYDQNGFKFARNGYLDAFDNNFSVTIDPFTIDEDAPEGWNIPHMGETITARWNAPDAHACHAYFYRQATYDTNNDGWVDFDQWELVNQQINAPESGQINMTMDRRALDLALFVFCEHTCFPGYSSNIEWTGSNLEYWEGGYPTWWEQEQINECGEFDTSSEPYISYQRGDHYFIQNGSVSANAELSQDELTIGDYEKDPLNPEGWSFPAFDQTVPFSWNLPDGFKNCEYEIHAYMSIDSDSDGVPESTEYVNLGSAENLEASGSASFQTFPSVYRLVSLRLVMQCGHTCAEANGYYAPVVTLVWMPSPHLPNEPWWEDQCAGLEIGQYQEETYSQGPLKFKKSGHLNLFENAELNINGFNLDPEAPTGWLYPSTGTTMSFNWNVSNAYQCTPRVARFFGVDSDNDGTIDTLSWDRLFGLPDEYGQLGETGSSSFEYDQRLLRHVISVSCTHECFSNRRIKLEWEGANPTAWEDYNTWYDNMIPPWWEDGD